MITMDRFNSSEDIELNEFREWVELVHDHLPLSFDFNDSKKLDKWLNELFDNGIQYEEAAKMIYNTSNKAFRYSIDEL